MTDDEHDAGLPQCAVLRCPTTMDGVFTTGGWRRMEFAVCAPHGERLAGGELYRLDAAQHEVILMGSDLAGLHEWTLRAWSIAEAVGSSDATVKLTTRRLAGEGTREVEFSISPDKRRALAEMLSQPPWDDVPDEGGTFQRVGWRR